MAISAAGYLDHLKTYLKTSSPNGRNHYGGLCKADERRGLKDNEIVLADTDEATNERLKVQFSFSGSVLGIKLDACKEPLFHFLDSQNTRRPWQKRCDFVIFHAFGNQLKAYCIEFKQARTLIRQDAIMLQLHSGEAWCKTLHKLVSAYTGVNKQLKISKYVFTACQDPNPFLDPSGKYLKDHPSIRHYLFSDVDGQNLSFLQNSTVTSIR